MKYLVLSTHEVEAESVGEAMDHLQDRGVLTEITIRRATFLEDA